MIEKIGMYTEIRDERVIYFDNVEMSNKIHESVESWVKTAQRLDADSDSDGFVLAMLSRMTNLSG